MEIRPKNLKPINLKPFLKYLFQHLCRCAVRILNDVNTILNLWQRAALYVVYSDYIIL
jgi:hypothetical protein